MSTFHRRRVPWLSKICPKKQLEMLISNQCLDGYIILAPPIIISDCTDV